MDESDPGDLDAVVANLQAHASRLRNEIEEVNSLLARAAILRDGGEFEQFQDWWLSQHGPALNRAAEAIEELDEVGRGLAQEQP